MHWEASPFQTDDGQDVVKAKPSAAVVSEGWERVTKSSPARFAWSFTTSSAPAGEGRDLLLRDPQGSLGHLQKAFLLLLGGALVVFLRRWLRSQRPYSKPNATVVQDQLRTESGKGDGLSFSPKDQTFAKMSMS